MRCGSCGFENPEGLKFGNECGTALKRRCTQCSFANAPQAKFCGECGTTLAQQSSVPSAHPPVSYTPSYLADERAEAAMSLSTAQGFPVWLGFGTIVRGWVLAEQGEGEEGIAQIRQGIATYRAMGAENGRPYSCPLVSQDRKERGEGK